jgi:hypothetical protein
MRLNSQRYARRLRYMNGPGCVLGDIQGFGRIYDCGDCGGIHVAVGPVSITLSPEAYLQFVTLVHTSAANFEAWLQHRQGSGNTDQRTEKLNGNRDHSPDVL